MSGISNSTQPTLKDFLTSRFKPVSLDSKIEGTDKVDFQTTQLNALKALQAKTNSPNFFNGGLTSDSADESAPSSSTPSTSFGDLTGGIENTENEDSTFSFNTGSAGMFSKALLEQSQQAQSIFARFDAMKAKGDSFLPSELETSLDEAMESIGRGNPLSSEDIKKRSRMFFSFTSIQISKCSGDCPVEEKEDAEDKAKASITSIAFFATEYENDESVQQLTAIWQDTSAQNLEGIQDFVEKILASFFQGKPFETEEGNPDSVIKFKPATPERQETIKSIITTASEKIADTETVEKVTGTAPIIPAFNIIPRQNSNQTAEETEEEASVTAIEG
jgi:hypothetical protein